MNRFFFPLVFGLGAFAVLWVAVGFLMSQHLVALVMTTFIAATYGYGALELRQFRRVTGSLSKALSTLPDPLPNLDAWIATIHPTLQGPVRLRIDGERDGLPGPAFAPYLVGLLVMLGMLGTFLGLVVTLNGAVFALEGTTDLQAVRSALATPIKGLGLSFGTSVAGVASSAMLGMMSALSKRERIVVAHSLDTKIATELRTYSHFFQRQEAFRAVQLQSQALPALVTELKALISNTERMSLGLNERLVHNQEGFYSDVKSVYTDLAKSIDHSLRSSLMQSSQAAAQAIAPVVERAMMSISTDANIFYQRMVQDTQAQLEVLTQANHQQWRATALEIKGQYENICRTLERTTTAITTQTQNGSDKTLAAIGELVARSQELAVTRMESEAAWTRQHGHHMAEITQVMHADLNALRVAEEQRGHAAVERLGELQNSLASHLTTLGAALEEPIMRLVQVASEVPRAAAEVIDTLRQEVTDGIARDKDLLEERGRILGAQNNLLESIRRASTEQSGVIDALVKATDVTMKQVGLEFASRIDSETGRLALVADTVTSSAVEMASLGDTLAFAVRTFGEANDRLIANLQRIGTTMDKSMVRSDDQLGYYIAQAREIIDLSVVSQKDIVQELRSIRDSQITARDRVAS